MTTATPHRAATYSRTPTQGRPLTQRQVEVLRYAANGNTTVLIARHLGIRPDTATRLLQKAYQKLGASDRAHAVAIALVRGLIKPQEIALAGPVTGPAIEVAS